jgi:hypothetical protein
MAVTATEAESEACYSSGRDKRASRSSLCIGINLPLRFFAAWSRSSIAEPTAPVGPRTMSHVKLAISPARRPALAESRTITRLRSAFRLAEAYIKRSCKSSSDNTFACLPGNRISRAEKKRQSVPRTTDPRSQRRSGRTRTPPIRGLSQPLQEISAKPGPEVRQSHKKKGDLLMSRGSLDLCCIKSTSLNPDADSSRVQRGQRT